MEALKIFNELIAVLRDLQNVAGRKYDYVDMLSLFQTYSTGNCADAEVFSVAQDVIYESRDLMARIIASFDDVAKEYVRFQKFNKVQIPPRTWEGRQRRRWAEPGEPWDWRYLRDHGRWAPEGTSPPWKRQNSEEDSEMTDDDRQTSSEGLTNPETSLPSSSSDKLNQNMEDKLSLASDISELSTDQLPNVNPESPSKRMRLERDPETPSDKFPKDPKAPSE